MSIAQRKMCFVIACNANEALSGKPVQMSRERALEAWGEMLPAMQAVAHIWTIHAMPWRPTVTALVQNRRTLARRRVRAKKITGHA